MHLSNKITQRTLSFTLLISLLSLLCFEIEGSILIKRRTEVHPAKTTHVTLISPVLEENDEDIHEDLEYVLSEFIFNGNYTFLFSGQESYPVKKETAKAFYPLLDLYITFRTFRI